MMTDDPTRLLTVPMPEVESLEAGFVSPTALLDMFSPSAWVFDVVKFLTGVDVLGELVSPMSGHWTSVSAYGDALMKLSDCVDEVSGDVQLTAALMDESWEGNAADAAYLYFAKAAGSLSGHSRVLHRASEEYRKLARAMWHLMESMKGVLQAILDRGVRVGLYALAGSLTVETGVGAMVGYGLAAYELAKIVELVARVTGLVSLAESAIFGFGAFLSVATKDIQNVGTVQPIAAPLSLATAR